MTQETAADPADGSLAVWELTAGAHRITMENTNDCWLNLDQLAFVPAVAD